MALSLKAQVVIAVAAALAAPVCAQLTNFATIDYPGATRTLVIGINDLGDMVGTQYDRNNVGHGFLYKDGKFTTFDFPEATFTEGYDLNVAGEVVGYHIDAKKVGHGFLWSRGQFTTIDFPGGEASRAIGINAKGQIVGFYQKGTMMCGFLLSDGKFTAIDFPGATSTIAHSINDQGEIMGRWNDAAGKRRGYRLSQGKFITFEFPGAQSTLTGIAHLSNSGDVAGPYTDARGRTRSFVLSKETYTSFEVPGSSATSAYDINSAGLVVGNYTDTSGGHGFVASIAPASPTQPVFVDDDGAECPGALLTIQEAVLRAQPGATILVCRGIYTNTVNVTGPEKKGLQLIALGRTNEVILQGDYAARDGFHLENVSNVLIRGFTVRDFGTKATTATEWGAGHLVYLENAHFNTIEHNQLSNGDRAAVLLLDSADNVVQQNTAYADNAALATCGIEVQGANAARNTIRQNLAFGHKLAGIMLAGAGPGNIVRDNTVLANGRFGIDIQNTSEAWIEGNRVGYGRGFWGTTPGGQQPGLGINLVNLLKSVVFDNRARNNSGADLNWDGKGDNRFEANACESCTPAAVCQK